jgi:hypothetical protein
MDIKEIRAELERIDQDVMKLRRADFDIIGDPVFITGLRQHIVLSLSEVREHLDRLVMSLDHIDDLDKVVGLRARIIEKVRKAIGTGEDQ